ncbi:MAG: peptidoglycan DD-metalloendopeptidase family protein [Parvibaculales bacterium]
MSTEIKATKATKETKAAKQTGPKSKSRLRFVLTALILFLGGLWQVNTHFIPDENGTRLSARPAPARPFVHPDWLDTPPMHRSTKSLTVKPGDNLMTLLTRQGVDAVTADAALDALRGVFDARRLKVGQKIRLYYQHSGRQAPEDAAFAGLDFIPAPSERVIVRLLADGRFQAVTANRPLTDRFFLTDTPIASSLYESARATGMAPKLVLELIRLFSFTIDFQREIREGDRLEVLYTRRFDEDGNLADEGKILFAALTIKGERRAYWHFARGPDDFGHYNAQGDSLERLLMKTPLDGARLSSRYGMRKHPILGYTRLHKGVDFAARRGTPIYAAGDAEIVALGRAGDHGRRIILRHSDGYETLYAHLSRYAKDLQPGDRVQQGQTIGYVGQSGLATGPVLHFEVSRNGQSLNPLALDLPPRATVAPADRDAFRDVRLEINRITTELAAGL